ncbi:glycosyltransferase family A protein [Methylobacterium haplocladii]|uniref:Glycosyltransferase 2-like domain-containing protein n=1 Tax=Methylobacterium haplocladii TaxID=1176176 RepID=A0A512IMI1_9HYPH|nr:glycosyltransferase family A protein [Methylobacterium haplocladii]GEO98926.1 hypothetical protein MHA02_13140 [Methylobacterium haplocladii]GJD85274.1 hypothetical protein HPGCJGGD_3161 [Methylobacterium haplocladii]GLS58084.1 hypothetical protein GCM10007887_07400 [Methylobacterium haplocladii]
MTPSVDVSLIVNLHREGELCLPSIESARSAIETARGAGLTCELVLMLDSCDAPTREAAERTNHGARLAFTDCGDLGDARNHAVAVAAGHFVAFLDGDDLCCRNWLVRALAECRSYLSLSIVHPQMNLFFGRRYKNYFWLHPDMRHDDVMMSRLLVENLWTSSVLAPIDIFREIPYTRNDISSGFGYEDWTWNISTAARGITHIVAPDTIHFIRRKHRYSLMAASNEAHVIPRLAGFSSEHLFDPAFLERPLGRHLSVPTANRG